MPSSGGQDQAAAQLRVDALARPVALDARCRCPACSPRTEELLADDGADHRQAGRDAEAGEDRRQRRRELQLAQPRPAIGAAQREQVVLALVDRQQAEQRVGHDREDRDHHARRCTRCGTSRRRRSSRSPARWPGSGSPAAATRYGYDRALDPLGLRHEDGEDDAEHDRDHQADERDERRPLEPVEQRAASDRSRGTTRAITVSGAGTRKPGLSKMCSQPSVVHAVPDADEDAEHDAAGRSRRLHGKRSLALRSAPATSSTIVVGRLGATCRSSAAACSVPRSTLMRALLAGRGDTSPRQRRRTRRRSAARASAGRRTGRRSRRRCGPGRARHHQHPRRQEHRLGDRVGDEQRRRSRLRWNRREQLVVEALAGDLVDRAERLVEQEHLRARSTSERASEARIFMPPDSCLGYLSSNPVSPTSSMASAARRSRSALATPSSSASSSTLRCTVRHCSSVASWNT